MIAGGTRMIIVDIDGTVSKVGDRINCITNGNKDWDSFYARCVEDEPIQTIIDLVYNLFICGHDIIFCTGRSESVRKETLAWIYENFPKKFMVTDLLMRPNGDYRHDTETKIESCSNSGIMLQEIEFVLEDRNSMVEKWRSLGVTCLQVADGDF
jgi:hypothetical protein